MIATESAHRGCLRSPGQELWTCLLPHLLTPGRLIPTWPGGRGSSPGRARHTGLLSLAVTCRYLSEDTRDVITCLDTAASSTAQRKGLINHLVSLALPAGSLSSVIAWWIRVCILKSCCPCSRICRAVPFFLELRGQLPVVAFYLPDSLPVLLPFPTASLLPSCLTPSITGFIRLLGWLG